MGCATGVGRSIGLKNPQNHNSLGRDSMLRYMKSTVYAVAAAAAFAAMVAIPAIAQDKQPIKIGFGMAETGPLGPNGKSALLAKEIWVEETNANGGLLGPATHTPGMIPSFSAPVFDFRAHFCHSAPGNARFRLQ